MDLLGGGWGVFSAFLVFLIGVIVCTSAAKSFSVSPLNALFLYGWHTFFCIIYCIYVLRAGGDAIAYYNNAISDGYSLELGTSFISVMARPFVNELNFSFLGVNLIFNILGSIGLLAFYGALKSEVALKAKWIKRLAFLIVILPSVSFWSSALGKDSLAFMATGLALWAALNLHKRFLLMVFSIFVMLIARPHMAGIMLLALSASFLFDSRAGVLLKFLLMVIGIACSIVLIPFALDYAGLGANAGLDDVEYYIETRQGYNLEGGGGIDIASMSLPMQLLTYLFRPLPFEAHSIFALAASLDNILLIFLMILGLFGAARGRHSGIYANRVFLWFYVLAALFVLAPITANLGIAMRQKWMFLPMLIFLVFSFIGKSKPISNNNINSHIIKQN